MPKVEDVLPLVKEVVSLREQLNEAREVIEFYSCNDFEDPGTAIELLSIKDVLGNKARAYLEKYPKGEK